MISINVDISALTDEIDKLKSLETGKPEGSKMLREIASTICGEMVARIHQKGIKSDGSPIGTYDPKYIKKRVKSPYNRRADSKVILALNDYMANDFNIGQTNPIDLKDQGIGLGFTQPVKADGVTNNEKRLFMEEKYGKIYDLTKEEEEKVQQIADKYIAELL